MSEELLELDIENMGLFPSATIDEANKKALSWLRYYQVKEIMSSPDYDYTAVRQRLKNIGIL